MACSRSSSFVSSPSTKSITFGLSSTTLMSLTSSWKRIPQGSATVKHSIKPQRHIILLLNLYHLLLLPSTFCTRHHLHHPLRPLPLLIPSPLHYANQLDNPSPNFGSQVGDEKMMSRPPEQLPFPLLLLLFLLLILGNNSSEYFHEHDHDHKKKLISQPQENLPSTCTHAHNSSDDDDIVRQNSNTNFIT
ncbi:unnamed protein product [Orchesella dallaii]|uniref:Transmembrane protein n=1 Tax=Orchesella dallaii TaxID=48710 RepID=A0ABP1PQ06_9HEXA